MSRNKYPEETVQRILDVSLELFIKNGYESTSIQQIVDNLGGLTKGAIYHHFKSKEEILSEVSKKIYSVIENKVREIYRRTDLSAVEKLREMFRVSLEDTNQDKLFAASPKLLDNPNILAMQLKVTIEESAPKYIQPIIEDGIKDGSIKTDYPKEMAEVIVFLSNIWLNPLIYNVSEEELIRKIEFYDIVLKGIGISIISDSMYTMFKKFGILSNR